MTVATAVSVRSLREGDDAAVAEIFAATMLLGSRSDQPIVHFDRYADLCLGWYLGPGRADAAVAECDGTIVGYSLVCTDSADQAGWVRRHSASLMGPVSWQLITFRLDSFSRRFYAARARDARALWRAGHEPLMPVHAHLNVVPHARTGTTALLLRDHIDTRARLAGSAGWWAEMNASDGRRERALERLGLHVVQRTRNETLSSVMQVDVNRLTLVRELPVATDK
jgi:hypothetical protein